MIVFVLAGTKKVESFLAHTAITEFLDNLNLVQITGIYTHDRFMTMLYTDDIFSMKSAKGSFDHIFEADPYVRMN